MRRKTRRKSARFRVGRWIRPVDRVAPYPSHYSPALAFSAILYPLGHRRFFRTRFPGRFLRGPVGLITFPIRNIRTTRDLSIRRCGVAVSVDPNKRESTIRCPQSRASSLVPQLWLVADNDAYESSLMLSLNALTLAPRSLLQGSFSLSSRFGLPFPAGTFPSASHPGITPRACDGGFCLPKSRSITGQFY